ncbi:Taurine dioxygenase, alpha-ketoglutarate-dependent [Streptomyces zhaozhouensis]|uniref:Taurine dioxygenase, alpha-ketoglutarate-dependent n=1 Tax=Streptomyces zhaozhouensis TaxID=1300267 RepID=A0A286DLB9_9ACTN|nr:TauD/TfdA family dioxygenase [Streptomyces zhaozhouensis]SOD59527.1 Taurine dioxygenase, alpha-ketoglutarate-dependent [Streptomyces zhaozhouensis]
MSEVNVHIQPIETTDRCGVVLAADERVPLSGWLDSGAGTVEKLVHEHGAVVLRNFATEGDDDIRAIVTRLSGPPLDYTERSSPRSEVSSGIYTSTDYPSEKRIFLHNEQSYNLRFPERLYFHCVTAAEEGGATILADSRRVHERLTPQLRARFADGYRLVRNYRPHVGLSWQEVFQTTDRDEVARYCAANDIDVEWLGDDELRTSQLRPVVARHPATGARCWFNHLTFFHVSSLGEELARMLVDAYGEDGLPTNTYHADGSSIAPELTDQLRDAYERECVSPSWEEGDLMIVDNLLASHGRAPYRGARRIVVSMAGAVTWSQVATTVS